MSCLALSHFWTTQAVCNFPMFTVNKCRGWNGLHCASLQMLFLCSCSSCFSCLAAVWVFLRHPPNPSSHAVPCCNIYVSSPLSCLLRNSPVPVKAAQNDSIRYLSDCMMDIADHICASHRWIVLSTANFRLQIFLRNRWVCAALTSPLLPCGYCEAYTIFSAGYFANLFFFSFLFVNGLGLVHEKPCHSFSQIASLTFIFSLKLLTSCLGKGFFFLHGKKQLLLLLNFPFFCDLLSLNAMTAIAFSPCPRKS